MSDESWREEVLGTTGVFNGGQEDLLSMRRLVLANIPEYIYRYRSGSDDDLDALKRAYEWLSYPDGYNDPFDARIFYNHEEALTPILNKKLNEFMVGDVQAQFKWLTGQDRLDVNGERGDLQLLKKARKNLGLRFYSAEKNCLEMADIWKELAKNVQARAEESIRKKALICSFTTKYRNYLMWAHYARSHTGYCLEYKSDDFLIDQGFVLPVAYRNSPIDVTDLLKKGVQGEKNCAVSAVMGSTLVKSLAWKYEYEWRYICYSDRKDRELKGLQLNKVLLGCNASEDLTQRVVNICRQRGVDVVRMKRSPDSFELVDGERLV